MSYYNSYGMGDVATAAEPTEYEEFFQHVLTRTLTANQQQVDQSIFLEGDAPFVLLALAGTSTGNYALRLRRPNGKYLSNDFIDARNLIGTGQFPVPVWPAIEIPSSGRLGIDLKDTSGSSNTIELVLCGVKRFRR